MTIVSDILLVGAGLSGMSIAYELSKRGHKVTVIDSGGIGERTSATNQGGVRQQFHDETNIRAGLKTLELVAGFKDELGVDPEFRQVGYAFMLGQSTNTAHYLASVKRQNALGGATRILTPGEIADLWPAVEVGDLTGATYNPDEGCVNAEAVTRGYYEAAKRNGVAFRLGEEVIRFELSASGITRVVTTGGSYSAGLVVNACGPWASQLATLYGQSLPITARLSPIYIANDATEDTPTIPMVIDAEQRITICPNPRGTMVGCSEKVAVDHPGWRAKTNWALMPKMVGKAERRCDFLKSRSMVDALTGYWEVTPDDHPIIGHDQTLNLFTSAGFSGHGVSIIPGLAPSVASAILGETPEIDLTLFDPQRFEKGLGAPTELWGSADWGAESGIKDTGADTAPQTAGVV